MQRYEVWVFGEDVEELPSEGGWQMFYATGDLKEARRYAKKCELTYGEDNVDLR